MVTISVCYHCKVRYSAQTCKQQYCSPQCKREAKIAVSNDKWAAREAQGKRCEWEGRGTSNKPTDEELLA